MSDSLVSVSPRNDISTNEGKRINCAGTICPTRKRTK
jgi:hypothetical protein